MGMFAGKTMAAGGSFPWRVLLPQKLAKVFMKNDFYTYAYLREDGTPYYIGKGRKYRAYSGNHKACPVPPKERILFLKQNLTEEEAFRHEIYMIAVFGRKDIATGILRNRSDGGGRSRAGGKGNFREGTTHTEETKRKIGLAHKGKVVSEETRSKLRKQTSQRKWWNNGVEQRHCHECPGEGWINGRMRFKANTIKGETSGTF
jgi:hypothetical protein